MSTVRQLACSDGTTLGVVRRAEMWIFRCSADNCTPLHWQVGPSCRCRSWAEKGTFSCDLTCGKAPQLNSSRTTGLSGDFMTVSTAQKYGTPSTRDFWPPSTTYFTRLGPGATDIFVSSSWSNAAQFASSDGGVLCSELAVRGSTASQAPGRDLTLRSWPYTPWPRAWLSFDCRNNPICLQHWHF